MLKFTGDEGELVAVATLQELTEPFQKREKALKARKDNLIHAEFFGINNFNALIKQHGEKCVGFRVYYGTRTEDHSGIKPVFGKGLPTPRLVIVPVDSDGNDLISENQHGLKDMAVQKQAMVGGPVCPPQCGK